MSTAAHAAGVVELFGALAYGELTGFSRLAGDAELAPTTAARTELSRLAARQFQHFEALEARLRELGVDPQDAMAPFVAPVDAFHERTAPRSWGERLLKAYVGDGLATDFYREVGPCVDEADRALIEQALRSEGRSELVEAELRRVVEAEPTRAGRLSMWGRRMVGEALSQAQRVAVDHPGLVALISDGADLGEVTHLLGRLADAHTERMQRLGLTA